MAGYYMLDKVNGAQWANPVAMRPGVDWFESQAFPTDPAYAYDVLAPREPVQTMGVGMHEGDPAYSAVSMAWYALGLAGGALGAYHGYKRNDDSVGWAIGWFFFGSIIPVLALPIMFAQGFAERE